MPDNTTPPPASTATPKRTRNAINKEFLNELDRSRKVAAAAQQPEHLGKLSEVELDDTVAAQAILLADQIETTLGQLTGKRATKKQMTADEKAARDNLIALLQPIQTAAKRKYKGATSDLRDAYYIGHPLPSEDLDTVIAAARAIRDRLKPGPNNAPPADTLPGVNPATHVQNLSDAVADYDARNTAQGTSQRAAARSLEDIQADLVRLADLRRDIQLAADQAWPWRTAGVKTIRKAFLLPEDRPITD